MRRVVCSVVLAGAVLAPVSLAAPSGADAAPSAKRKAPKSVTVCRRGCRYATIQKGVDAVRKGGTVKVKPGTYPEAVTVRKDRITIRGLKGAKRTILQGKGAKDDQGNAAQNGVFVDGADGVRLTGMTARNYAGNGFFVRNANGYTFDHLVAAYNRAYGLYAFNSIGGTMRDSEGYGHGDSGFYIGQTPVQSKPKRTTMTRLNAHENVVGYSGTNAKYIDITNSDFYNNGAGVAPSTLKSEKFPPAEDTTVKNNRIFWNNFNYFKKDSKVKPLPAATGDFNYPIGVGVAVFGTTRWTVTDNDVFGNFKWGLMVTADPRYAPANTIDNTIAGNRWGADGKDPNQVDLFSWGSGSGNCYDEPTATRDPGGQPDSVLYPACSTPRPANGNDAVNLKELLDYTSQGETQADSFVVHPHIKVDDYTPVDGQPVQ